MEKKSQYTFFVEYRLTGRTENAGVLIACLYQGVYTYVIKVQC